MIDALIGKVAAVTGAASGIGLASAEAMLAAGARVVAIDRDEAALTQLHAKHGDALLPLVMDLLDASDCATLLPQDPDIGRPARHSARQRRQLRRRRPRRRRPGCDRPHAEPERQRGDEEHPQRPAPHDRARDRRHHRHQFARRPFPNALGAGLRVLQVGHQLLRPNSPPPGIQARDPGRLDLARPRDHRATRRLAGGETAGRA